MANEPVYNQQVTAYLLRDHVKAAIPAFYSMMACAFSHSSLEPLEHRWHHPQYFGPPSTDGTWFELYRNMLLQEREDDSLLLLQAIPRQWLEVGKQIRISTRAEPLWNCQPGCGQPDGRPGNPGQRSLRAAHACEGVHSSLAASARLAIQSVTLNGKEWTDFDASQEWVRIPNPTEADYAIVARY